MKYLATLGMPLVKDHNSISDHLVGSASLGIELAGVVADGPGSKKVSPVNSRKSTS
jgi:hypothetical protein